MILAHGILDAEKSHSLPSASWRSQEDQWYSSKAHEHDSQWHRLQFESEGLRTRSVEGKDCCRAPLRQSILPYQPFCSIQTLSRLHSAYPHWGGTSTLLKPPTQMLISSKNIQGHIQKYCLTSYLSNPRCN